MFIKQKSGDNNKDNQRLSYKLAMIYFLLVLLFTVLIVLL